MGASLLALAKSIYYEWAPRNVARALNVLF